MYCIMYVQILEYKRIISVSFTTFLKSFIFKNFKRELPYTKTVGRLFHLMVNNVQDNQKNKTPKNS